MSATRAVHLFPPENRTVHQLEAQFSIFEMAMVLHHTASPHMKDFEVTLDGKPLEAAEIDLSTGTVNLRSKL